MKQLYKVSSFRLTFHIVDIITNKKDNIAIITNQKRDFVTILSD